MDRLGYDRYDAAFEVMTAQLGEAASACAPDDPVPICPEWTVHELVTHVGTGHRWAAGIVERRVQQPVRQTPHPAPGAWTRHTRKRKSSVMPHSWPIGWPAESFRWSFQHEDNLAPVTRRPSARCSAQA